MIPWLKNLFTDETTWVGSVRSLLFGVGGGVLLPTEQLPVGLESAFGWLPDWAGVVALMAAGFVRSSTKKG